MDDGIFYSAASATASVISALAAWAAIWYSNRQSKKQQEIIDKQNTFLQTTTRIDCLNRRKEKVEEIVKGYDSSKDLKDKIKLFLDNVQYFSDNISREEFHICVAEYIDAKEKFIPIHGIGWNDNEERPDRKNFFEKEKCLNKNMDNLYNGFLKKIFDLQHKIDELEASLMRE